MKMPAFVQHEGKVCEAGNRFAHVMAITLDPSSEYKEGIIRCVLNRKGNVEIKGYVDHSQLFLVSGDSLDHFIIGERLKIRKEDETLEKLTPEGQKCIGLEDPDIWIDPETVLMHTYFTIPIKPPESGGKIRMHLGHAVGRNLHSLEMTEPVLLDDQTVNTSAKEVSIVPMNSKGVRYNLIESRDRRTKDTYPVVRVAIAENMGQPWKYGDIVFHPTEHNLKWVGEHASPGPFLPRSFIDLGPNKLLGIMNGREANIHIGEEIRYGTFSVGLFIYDYEHGKIEWVSPEPLIQDTAAKTITFASHFVETKPGKGILYAHVDDSFVRAYTLYADGIRELLP